MSWFKSLFGGGSEQKAERKFQQPAPFLNTKLSASGSEQPPSALPSPQRPRSTSPPKGSLYRPRHSAPQGKFTEGLFAGKVGWKHQNPPRPLEKEKEEDKEDPDDLQTSTGQSRKDGLSRQPAVSFRLERPGPPVPPKNDAPGDFSTNHRPFSFQGDEPLGDPRPSTSSSARSRKDGLSRQPALSRRPARPGPPVPPKDNEEGDSTSNHRPFSFLPENRVLPSFETVQQQGAQTLPTLSPNDRAGDSLNRRPFSFDPRGEELKAAPQPASSSNLPPDPHHKTPRGQNRLNRAEFLHNLEVEFGSVLERCGALRWP